MPADPKPAGCEHAGPKPAEPESAEVESPGPERIARDRAWAERAWTERGWTEPDEAGPRQPRRLSWGCLAALIIGGIGLIVVVIIAANLVGTALSGVQIR